MYYNSKKRTYTATAKTAPFTLVYSITKKQINKIILENID